MYFFVYMYDVCSVGSIEGRHTHLYSLTSLSIPIDAAIELGSNQHLQEHPGDM